MQGDNRDPDENEGNHAPAESQAPERVEKKAPQKFYKSEVELRMTVFGFATLE